MSFFIVIVQSLRGTPACDIDTLFFLNRGNKPLGRVFDVLGPVSEPLYAIRFNSYEQALEAGVKPGTPVYCAPRTPHTSYVFVSELMKYVYLMNLHEEFFFLAVVSKLLSFVFLIVLLASGLKEWLKSRLKAAVIIWSI